MALVRPGMIGQISGRLGGDVFSHNRFGQYIRKGTNPVTVTSEAALAAKARLGSVSSAWQELSSAQRDAWTQYAQTNPIKNRLGESVINTGHGTFAGINARRLALPVAISEEPPTEPPPPPLNSLSLTADIGAGDVSMVFTPTPLAANNRAMILATVLDSAGINYVSNLLRFISGGSTPDASPYVFEALLSARFGVLQVGQIIVVRAVVVSAATGLISGALEARETIVSTV